MGKRSERRKKHKQKVRSTITNNFFDKNYKKLAIIPFILLLLAITQIGIQTAVTGDFITKGVSLAGGTSVTIDTALLIEDLESQLSTQFPDFDIRVREIANAGEHVGTIIESTIIDESDRDQLLTYVEQTFSVTPEQYAVEVIGPSLGQSFFVQTFSALIFAFFLMAVIVFIFFRSFVPSISVVLAALTDIIVTAAIVNLMGIHLSTAGIAAFLMLIGYAVDTNILLSNKMLKNSGPLFKRFTEAFRTGSFMTVTTLSAILVALIFTQSEVIRQITTIVFIGLLVDFLSTWLQNAGLLRYYLESIGEDESEKTN